VVKAEIVKAAPSAVAAPMPPSGGGKPAGLLSRVGRLFRSKVEHAVDQATDPAKVIEQLVVEMEDEIRRGRDETRKMMATQKLAAARTRNLEKSVADWTARAEVAVRAGDDALAKEALTRRTIAEGELADSRREQREAAGYAERMREGLRKNEAKLREIKLRKGTIKAKLAGARTAEVRAAALDEFERMAGKIDENESNVEAEAELIREDEDAKAASAATEAKFAKLERAGGPGSDLDARLAELKRKMGK
jgi:phage shock protein A